MSKLTEEQVAVNLSLLPLWKHEGEKLVKTFVKETFVDAIDFVVAIAKLAEAANHHPDIQIKYNKVTISLITHDSLGVTGKDFLLAQQIEGIE